MIYWTDIIEEIVESVQTDSDKPASLKTDAPYYMHGHPLEIHTILEEKGHSGTLKFERFPLIALIQDFDEENNQDASPSKAELRIIIAQVTDPNFDITQRYDSTFRTVLGPLYDLLIKHIVESGWFKNCSASLCPHTKTDRPYWGREIDGNSQENIWNEFIDAIEIRNLQLDLRLKRNCIK